MGEGGDGDNALILSPIGNTFVGVTCLVEVPVSFPSPAMSMMMWKTMTKKMREMLKRSHTSTILKYEVLGSDVEVCGA